MDAAELRAYRQRWQRVDDRKRESHAATTLDARLAGVAALMASVDAMGWRDALDDDGPIWARWQRLRRHYNVQP